MDPSAQILTWRIHVRKPALTSHLDEIDMPPPIVLTIAGSDSGGGAGIQADLKTFSALSVYGASVITALTAQNTREVRSVHHVPPAFVREQLEAVFEDLDVAAIKIGMLGDGAMVECVATCLERWTVPAIILDPVMVAKSGDPLLESSAVQALVERLLPLAHLVTPNLPEARVLTGGEVLSDLDGMRRASERLVERGARAVLIKGGHLEGDRLFDLYREGEEECVFEGTRFETDNTHGTGCTLSSAIAAFRARGVALREAVQEARTYLRGAISRADDLAVGSGHGPVHHFHALWK